MTLQENPQAAEELRRLAQQQMEAGAFELARPTLESLCALPEAGGWDYYRLARVQYKLGRHEEALQACREAWKRLPDPRPEALRNLYGWCIYQSRLRRASVGTGAPEADEPSDALQQAEGRLSEAVRAAEAICQLTAPGSCSPYNKAVLALSRMLKQRARWEALEQWTGRLDPATLSAAPLRLEDPGGGRPRVLASELETWYGLRCRALLELGRWQDCIDLCQRYEASGLRPHHDWDVWIPSYQARALEALGRRDEAAGLLDRLLARKRAPALLRLRAELWRAAGEADRAWQTALDGALELPEAKNDPALISLLEELAAARGEAEAARRHLELALLLRTAEGWRIAEPLRRRAAERGVPLPDGDARRRLRSVFAELHRWWWQQLEAVEPRQEGTVELVRERAGFLRTAAGTSLYFDPRDLRGAAPGQRVSFWVRPNWDAKKQRVAPRAIRLRKAGGSPSGEENSGRQGAP